MNDPRSRQGWMQKNWTSLLGAVFILAAFVYFFKYTIDQGWVTDGMKIGIGLLLGVALAAFGGRFILKQRFMSMGEIIAGLGVAVLYTTFSFAGIYYAIWTPLTVFIAMSLMSALLTFGAFKFKLRILMNIALIGALFSPLVLRPEVEHVFSLFLYLLVVNVAYWLLSISKQWSELRIIAFVGTWLLYTVYAFEIDYYRVDWYTPFGYALAAYIFFTAILLFASLRENLRFNGMHLYLSFANAVLFSLWSLTILEDVFSFYYVLAAMGLLYIVLGWLVYRMTQLFSAPVIVKVYGGLFLILVATAQFGEGLAIKPMINVFLWSLITIILIVMGRKFRQVWFDLAAFFIWFFVLLYWYAVTWVTPRGEWFGVYIPFLNWGAVSWIVLAAIGFYFSRHLRFKSWDESGNRVISGLTATMSHLVVGGLLTKQLVNLFSEYELSYAALPLTLSISWGIYALLLFLWGAYYRQKLFQVFGSIVLLLVAMKTLIFDLSGEETIYRIIALLVLGLISFAITAINNYWKPKAASEDNP